MEQTGGGPDITVEVNPIEDRILNVIGGKQLIHGNIEVPEPGLVVNLDHDYDMKIDHVEIATEENLENKCSTPSSRKVRPPVKMTSESSKKTNLKALVEASNTFINLTKEKIKIKESYYNKKLEVLREANSIQNRIANALEKLIEEKK